MGILTRGLAWVSDHAEVTTALIALSVVILIASLWVGRRYLVSIPADYFVTEHKPLERWRRTRPLVWWTLMISKNLLGMVLIVLGVIMLFTPGQGLLTLFLGVALTNFPGKQRIERAIIQRPAILSLVNAQRARAGKPPLMF